jgi:hypothetical protein
MIKLLCVLTVTAAVMAMATAAVIKPKIFATAEFAAPPPTVAISPEELHRHVDMRTLPVTDLKDLY